MDKGGPGEKEVGRKEVYLGEKLFTFPSDRLGRLQDHTEKHRQGDWDGLRRELSKRGYLLIRGLHAREEVLKARQVVLDHVAASGPGKLVGPTESGVLDSRCGRGCVPFMEGRNTLTHCPEVKAVLEGERPKNFFRHLLCGEGKLLGDVKTFDFKWLRGVHREGFTGAHVDNVYMGRGTSELLTMWTPFGDVSLDMGCLAVVEASHTAPQFKQLQETYGSCDLEAESVEGSGWFTEDPTEISARFGCDWKTESFSAGDVLIFTSRTIHMSTKNTSEMLRVSCDTRWQRADQPIDPRYIGEEFPWLGEAPKHGLWAEEEKSKRLTMEDMKQRWGFEHIGTL